MKNAINYFYNLEVSDIYHIDDNYKFKIGNDYYILLLLKYPQPLEKIYQLSSTLYQHGIYNHQIILNKEGQLTTMINEKTYLLLWYYQEMKENITLDSIVTFSQQNFSFLENHFMEWDNLWASKIDYFEYQMSECKQKYPLLKDSINYFIGIAETGISLFRFNKREYNNVGITHNRVNPQDTIFDLYNPLTFVIDIKVRDTAEYFKACFLEEDVFLKITSYIKNANLDNYELLMFYIRFFYPSFYFDIYEKIMAQEVEEKEILVAIQKAKDYEMLLKKLYQFISQYIVLPDIEWIKKM